MQDLDRKLHWIHDEMCKEIGEDAAKGGCLRNGLIAGAILMFIFGVKHSAGGAGGSFILILLPCALMLLLAKSISGSGAKQKIISNILRQDKQFIDAAVEEWLQKQACGE